MKVVKVKIIKLFWRVSEKTVAFLLSLSLVLLGSLYPATEVNAAVAVSYVTGSSSTANNATYTFSTLSLGAAAADRYIIVAVHGGDDGGGNIISSVTVAGIQATIVTQHFNDTGTPVTVAGLAIVRVTAGTTGDVVVTFDETMLRAAVGIYRVTGISAATPVDIAISTSNDPSGSMDVPADGFIIGAVSNNSNTTATWTGVTETADAVIETNLQATGGMSTFGTTQTNLTVQATLVTDSTPVGVFASWAPGGYSAPSGQTTFTSPVVINESAAVTGALAKGSGTFVIDHPLDPVRKMLFHSFVESPDVKNIYDGNVVLDKSGSATVKLPDYFQALNKDYRFLLTPIGNPAPELFVQSSGVEDNQFTIAGGPPNTKVSWQVTGIRQDPYILANPIINEVMKGPETIVDIGEYLFKGYLDIDLNQ